MAIILDTDVIIHAERGTFDLKAWLSSHPGETFQIAAITVAEVWHGVERATATYKQRREHYLLSVFGKMQILPYTEVTGIEHARIWAELEVAGRMIGSYDLIVAATAIEHGSALATFNEKHFRNVRGLTVIKPTLKRP